VYTALLTQSGGDGPLTTLSGALTVGVTYKLGTIQGNDDFTNVGAPTNEFGISFVATGTTPANWESETELEYNTGAPVVTVLENTIGNIWFTYDTVGKYYANSNGLFTENKTLALVYENSADVEGAIVQILSNRISNNQIAIENGADGNLSDNLIINRPIEIRVYN
jgi:hypothetical protein